MTRFVAKKYGICIGQAIMERAARGETDPEALDRIADRAMLMHRDGDDRAREEAEELMRAVASNPATGDATLSQLVAASPAAAEVAVRARRDAATRVAVWRMYGRRMIGDGGVVLMPTLLRHLLYQSGREALPDDVIVEIVERLARDEGNGRYLVALSYHSRGREAVMEALRGVTWFGGRARRKAERTHRVR